MSKSSFIVKDTVVLTAVQQILVYLCDYRQLHKNPSNILNKDDVVELYADKLEVNTTAGVCKFKLDLNYDVEKLFNFASGPSVLSVKDDWIIYHFSKVIRSYIKIVTTTTGLDIELNRIVGAVNMLGKTELAGTYNNIFREHLDDFNKWYDVWEKGMMALYLSGNVEHDTVLSLKLIPPFADGRMLTFHNDTITVVLTPECVRWYLNENPTVQHGGTHSLYQIGLLHYLQQTFNLTSNKLEIDVINSLYETKTNLSYLLNRPSDECPEVLTEYNLGNHRHFAVLEKNGEVSMFEVGRNYIGTVFGKDVGFHSYKEASETQKSEWLDIIRKNPSIAI